ncbi:MAG: bis-aminopropyl spermidine synthase family protein [Candidatus Hodarchaeales archaeon]|jgi:predicted methyltransferase
MIEDNNDFQKTIEKSFIILQSLALKSNLKDGAEAVRLGLLALWRFPEENTRSIAEYSGLSVPGISSLRKELVKINFLKNLKEFSIKGEEFIKKILNFSSLKGIPIYYDQNLTNTFYSDYFTDEFASELEQILDKRPHPKPEFDQSRINFETTIKKIKALLAHGDLEGRRICFLGDDDGISISLAVFKRYNPQFNFSISVIDIDDLVINYIKKFDLNNEISVLKRDLRLGNIPDNWLNKFDVILTDPPYTIDGVRLFLSQAYNLFHYNLKNSKDKIYFKPVYFSFSNKPSLFTFKLIQTILSEHFSIDTLYKRFNFYSGERLIYRYGNMWILKSLPKNTDNSGIKDIDLDKVYTWQILEGGKPRNKRIKTKN